MSHQQAATEKKAIRYSILLDDCERHSIEVIALLPAEGAQSIELMMPVWTPGSYLVREYSKNIESLSISDAVTGVVLPSSKWAKNRWRVETGEATLVKVQYRLYCREMSVRTNWVERDFGFLTGAATFLTREDWLDHPHEVNIELPTHWRNVATSLKQIVGQGETTRIARNYDELVDSPILMGELDTIPFEVNGKKHYFANGLGGGLWDYSRAVKDMTTIIEHEQAFWDVTPYESYWFLNIASETAGGLEHDNCCVLMSSRWAMKKRTQYLDWLALVSHEFFHTWNVRRLRPKRLVKYDYSQEQYFPELWIAEGITSYYDDLFIAQTSLCSREEYFGRLSKNIALVQNGAGRLVQPLHDSSMDTWIKFYRPDENSINSRTSYYAKGAVVSLLLDCEIQRKTGGRNSLRDVMKRLWKDHLQVGYTQSDFVKITNAIVGEEMDEWFHQAIHEATETDYFPFLDWYGLQFKSASDSTTKESETTNPLEAWIGCETGMQDSRLIVKRIPRGTPADIAGLNVDDELIAMDGFRLTGPLQDRLAYYAPGTQVKLMIARRGSVQTLDLCIGSKPLDGWQLELVSKPTEAQSRNLAHWLLVGQRHF